MIETESRERNLEGKAALRARGLFPGGTPPYGFSVVKEGRFSRLVPDEHEQTVIKTARLLWDQGLPMKQILAGLEARGFRNRAGNPFSSAHIYRWTAWSADPDHVNISERTKAALARRKAAGQKLGNPEIRKISPLGVAAVMQNAAQRVADVMPHIDDLISGGGFRISRNGSGTQCFPDTERTRRPMAWIERAQCDEGGGPLVPCENRRGVSL